MARDKSAAYVNQYGRIIVGDVTLPDKRVKNLRNLLIDLSSPNVCIVLGSGASAGLVPMSAKDQANEAWRLFKNSSSFNASPIRIDTGSQNLDFVKKIMDEHPTDDPHDFYIELSRTISDGQLSCMANMIFTPCQVIPPYLVDIYKLINCEYGTIVSYNYDRIVEGQTCFPVIYPHGKALGSTFDLEQAFDNHVRVPTPFFPPAQENDSIRSEYGYDNMLLAWQNAKTIVFIGYSFGRGADKISFDDFCKYVNPSTKIHILCPPHDVHDQYKQICYSLRGRERDHKIYPQPFKWQAFCCAINKMIIDNNYSNVRNLIGYELDILITYDNVSNSNK